MQFNKIDGDGHGTIEVSENGVIGYITSLTSEKNGPPNTEVFFDFSDEVAPSLSLTEMKELVEYMEKLKNG